MTALGSILRRLQPLLAAAALSFTLAFPGHAASLTPPVPTGGLMQNEPNLVLDRSAAPVSFVSTPITS